MKFYTLMIMFFISTISLKAQFIVTAISDDLRSGTAAKVTPLAGAFSFPFKYRPQKDVIETSLSLSGVGGVNIDLGNSHAIGILAGVGPSSITLNQNNTDTSAHITSSTSRAAMTFSLSALYQFDQLQFAFSIGTDKNLDNTTDKWIYQSKLWLSFGIGFKIFVVSSPSRLKAEALKAQ